MKANIGHGGAISGLNVLVKLLLVCRSRDYRCMWKYKTQYTILFLIWRSVVLKYQGRSLSSWALENNFSAAGGNTASVVEDPSDPSRNAIDDRRQDRVVNVTVRSATVLRNNTQKLINYHTNTHGARPTQEYYSCVLSLTAGT